MTYVKGEDTRGAVKKIPNSGANTYAQRDQSYEEAKGVAAPAPGKGDGDDKGDKGYSCTYLSGSGKKYDATGKVPSRDGQKSGFSSQCPALPISGPRARGGK